MAFGLPQVTMTFNLAAQTAGSTAVTGKLALVLRDAAVTSNTILTFNTEPDTLAALEWSDASKAAISRAFLGRPSLVLLVVLPEAAALSAGYAILETQRFDVCTVAGLAEGEAAAFITWAKDAYDNKGKRALFVAASATAPDHPAIIHFDTTGIIVGGETYTAYDYLPRIAGALAGLQLWESATYLVLPEVDDCPHLTRAQANAAIAAGKLILYHDGEKVKIARGVTSLTTIGGNLSTEFQKAKVVRILNQLEKDIVSNVEDNYIGKVANSYIHKTLLLTAIRDYLVSLEKLSVLLPGLNTVDFDLARQRIYLKTKLPEAQVNAMDDDAVREAYTDDKLFLVGAVRPVDSVEDVAIAFTL
jgi:hypothetical protein